MYCDLSDECEGVVQDGDVFFLFRVEFDIVVMFVHVHSNLWFLEVALSCA